MHTGTAVCFAFHLQWKHVFLKFAITKSSQKFREHCFVGRPMLAALPRLHRNGMRSTASPLCVQIVSMVKKRLNKFALPLLQETTQSE